MLYFNFLDNLITCPKACEENNPTTFQPPLFTHSLIGMVNMLCQQTIKWVQSTCGGDTHYLIGNVNMLRGNTLFDWDGQYVVGKHII